MLGGDVGQRCRELLREIARSKEMVIYAGSINRDHVHMLIGIPPNLFGIESGAVSEREEFASSADGVQIVTQTVLEPTLMGTRLLGSEQWKRDG